MRDSVVIYRSWFEAMQGLEPTTKADLYEAIVRYGLNGEQPSFTGMAQVVWQLIKPNLDANIRKYENGRKGAEHGSKGGRPRKMETPAKPQRNPKRTPKEPQGNPMQTPNVNVNANVNVDVNENVNERVTRSRPRTIEWFKAECRKVVDTDPNLMPASEHKPFFDYWTEQSTNGKMRFEGEKYFDVRRRMMTWSKRSKQSTFTTSKADDYAEQQRIRKMIEQKYGIEPGGRIGKEHCPPEHWVLMGFDKMI